MNVSLNAEKAKEFLNQEQLKSAVSRGGEIVKELFGGEDREQVLGWLRTETAAVQMDLIREKAKEVREQADVFVIVGVGGSNQAARAMIEALTDRKGPEIVYLGNSLSPHYIAQMLKHLEGKSVYINVIAKNFETLEPGSHFRILRQYMKQKYSKEEMARRVILTGTIGSRLEEIAQENGYTFLSFPAAIGGRYSAFSPVGLFPVAAAGLDIDAFLAGVNEAQQLCMNHPGENPAVEYGAVRNLLYQKGFDIEMLVSFEPQFAFFNKWWVQLFGESEGKDKKGIFPSGAIYSEDLHSMGQYMQDGRRNLIETFLTVEEPGASVVIEADPEFGDRFDYLDGMDFKEINHAAEEATINAHAAGQVPCIQFKMKEINEKAFGELFYLFMMSCAVSGKLMGVNPFDQEGVEEYKRSMFKALGKN